MCPTWYWTRPIACLTSDSSHKSEVFAKTSGQIGRVGLYFLLFIYGKDWESLDQALRNDISSHFESLASRFFISSLLYSTALLFSATFAKKVERLAREQTNDPLRITIGSLGQANEDVAQTAIVVEDDSFKWGWVVARLEGFCAGWCFICWRRVGECTEEE